jgi:membrane protease YdiL (CAAX protease family)
MNTPEQFPVEPREDSRRAENEARLESEGQRAPLDPAAEPAGDAFAVFPLAESAERPPAQLIEPQYPPDLRVPWNGKDIILFVLFYLLSPVVLAVPMLVFAAAARHEDINALMKDMPTQATLSIIAQAAAALLSLGYLWVLAKARGASPFWESIGWKPLPDDDSARRKLIFAIIVGGIALAGIVTAVSNRIGVSKKLPIEEFIQTRQTMILLMTFGVLVAPLVEETVFRGLIYPVIARRSGVAASIIITGLLFGAVHSLQLWGGWAQIGLIVLVGIILTWVRATRHTVWASYLLHLTYNSTLFLGAFFATGGFRHM